MGVGVLVAELSSFGGRSGLGVIRLVVLFLSAIAILLHIVAFVYPYFFMGGSSEFVEPPPFPIPSNSHSHSASPICRRGCEPSKRSSMSRTSSSHSSSSCASSRFIPPRSSKARRGS